MKDENVHDAQSFFLRSINILANAYVCVCDVGVEPAQVQERVENHLKSLLIKHFDPQKADSIFTVEGEVRISISIFYHSNRN